jgi:hypothetical protein
MVEIRKFQEMIASMSVDSEGNITLLIEEVDVEGIIEELKRCLDGK